MKITMTFKLAPESRQNIIDTFAAEYRDFRSAMERVVANGGFGDPTKITLRWLLESGRWDDTQSTTQPQGDSNGTANAAAIVSTLGPRREPPDAG